MKTKGLQLENCPLSTVYCLLSTVYCILYTVYCLLCTVYCVLSTVIYLTSAIPPLLHTHCCVHKILFSTWHPIWETIYLLSGPLKILACHFSMASLLLPKQTSSLPFPPLLFLPYFLPPDVLMASPPRGLTGNNWALIQGRVLSCPSLSCWTCPQVIDSRERGGRQICLNTRWWTGYGHIPGGGGGVGNVLPRLEHMIGGEGAGAKNVRTGYGHIQGEGGVGL